MDVEQSQTDVGLAYRGELQAFLIADIRGYSTFTSQRGAAAAAHLATTFTDLSRDAVAARGGRVLGLRGDEVLAAFSSAGQAVRAAVDIQLACAEATAADPDFPLGVGAGVDFGEAVAGDQYHGAAINLAARLCAQAAAGQVLVTATVADAARSDVDLAFAAGPTVAIKGFERPVAILEARSVRAVAEPEAVGSGPDRVGLPAAALPLELDEATPLIGREGDLSWLRGMWRQARRGHGRVVLVAGPRGIGKTRLAAELAHQVSAGGRDVYYCGGGGTGQAETLAAIAAARAAKSPGLWVLDQLDLYPEAIAALLEAAEAIESHPALVVGLFREAGGDPNLSGLVDRLNLHGDSLRALIPLDLDGVVGIARGYVAEVDDLPAEAILRGSGGVPADIHELVTQWASTEAARRLEAAGAWLAEGKTRQAAGLRFADNVIAAHLGRIYDATRTEDHVGVCPYKGLGAFEESDAAYFFGREQLVGELAARTVGVGFLGVVGPSGSGKSSVVLAGLIPSLQAGLLPGSERWNHVVLRPGRHPLVALDRAQAGIGTAERHVLVIDQFEEVFSTADPAEREAFINRLVAVAHDPQVVVVITIRADFTGHCAPYPELADLLAANLVLVGPMTADQLRRAIEAPARRVGLRVESSLVDALVGEVVDEPGGLPLLSTALVQLWQARDGGWLRLDAYQESGGVRTAVARLAEASYQQLSPPEQQVAMTIFLRLVAQGEGDSAVRRRVPVAEFDIDEDPTVAAVLARLTRDRLLIRDDGLVEIAHEALIREWPRLSSWLKDDAVWRELRSHLTQAARLWADHDRDASDLYRGARLSAAQDWSQGHGQALNLLEREFLAQSRQASEKELGRQRRANRRLRALLAGTAVFLIVAVIAGLFAFIQRDHAQAQALKSDAQRTGTLAQTEPNLDLSLLLAVAGVKLKNVPETRSNLLAALQRNPAAIHLIRPSASEIDAIAISPDGQLLATGDTTGAVRFEDLRSWRRSGATIQLPAPVPPGAVRFSPDGRTLAVAAAQGNRSQLYAIEVGSRHSRLLGTWPEIVTPPPWSTTTIAYSPDGTDIAMGFGDNPPTAPLTTAERLVLVNASTGRELWQRKYPMLPGQGSQYVAFARDGALVTSADGGTTDLWDPRSGRIIRQYPTGGRLAVAPNSRLAAIGVISGTPGTDQSTSLQLLDLTRGTTRTLQAVPDATWITTVAFTPDGKTVVAGALDHDVRVWDTTSGSILQTFQSQSGGRIQVEIDPRGRTVLSSADDGSVTAWDLTGIQLLGQTFGWSTPDNCCSFGAINPAGTLMAADEYDGTVALIDLRALHLYASLPVIKGGLVASGLAFTPDGRLLVTGDQGGNVIFWNVRTRAAVRRLKVADPVTWLAVSPDERLLAVQTQASGGSNAHVQVLDVPSGSLLHTYAVPGSGGEGRDGQGGVGVAFSSDSREVAAVGCCSPVSSIQVWDAASGRLLFSPHITERESSIAFSPTSAVLAAGTSDGKIFLWDAHRGTPVRAPIQLAASNVQAIAFSPDGRELVASVQSGDTLLLDLASGQRMGTSFPDMPGTITGPLFTPQGDVMVLYNGVAADWPTDLSSWERFACQVAGRDMTPTEWANVLPNRHYQHVCPQ
jgi:WD40 repeat protein/class 3 adenylate cyclase